MPHFTARRCFEVPQQRLYASDHTNRIRDMTIYTHYKTIANRRTNKGKKGYGKSKIFMNEYCCLIHAENHEILLNITKGSFLCNSCTDCELKDKWVSFKGKIYEGPYLEFNGNKFKKDGGDSFEHMKDPGDTIPPIDPSGNWTEKGGICCYDDIYYYHVDPNKLLFNDDCDLNPYLNYVRMYANKKGGEKKRLTFGDDNDDNRNLHLNAKLIGFKYPSKIGFKDIEVSKHNVKICKKCCRSHG